MPVMNKAIKYRLYPNKDQQELFAKTFGCCRKVWNLMLADKKICYQNTKSFGMQTPAQYKTEYSYLREVDALALANVQRHLEKAIRDYCNNRKNGKRKGFPKFKAKKHAKHSYTTSKVQNNIVLSDHGIRLPKAGVVKAVIHRIPDPSWNLKSVTVSQTPDGKFYASVLFEYKHVVTYAVDDRRSIGLDYSSPHLYVDDQGRIGCNGHFYGKLEKRLAREQRKLSRKAGARKGETASRNYVKQQKRVAKIHREIADKRKDFLHKASTGIANRYDIVCVEDLDLKAIANKKRHLGKRIYDNGYGMFLQMLAYKLFDRGKVFVKIGRFYPSSQLCCHCGMRHPEMKDLGNRIMDCVCGNRMDRDRNAAINIKNEGLRLFHAGEAYC